MKRVGFFALIYILLLPLFANAGMIVWTARIIIVSNAVPEDSVFHYRVAQRGAINGDYTSFDNSTSAGTASKTLVVDALSGLYYDVFQNIPEGWKIDSISCSSDSSSSRYYPFDDGVSLVLAANTTVTCNFNNSKLAQSKTPVLIVPGIMGTEIYKETETLWPDINRMMVTNGDRFMDPLGYADNSTPIDTSLSVGSVLGEPSLFFDYSKALTEVFISQGYEPDKTLFTFPYDWRKDLSEIAAQNLTGQIDYILSQTESGKAVGKVDVIAHSQGGLVVKSLLYQRPEYQAKINKLVFVGTPNLGAPKAAKALLYGDSMGVDFAGLGLDPDEVKRIGRNMPAIYELLPSQSYFASSAGYLGVAEQLNPDMPLMHVKTLNFEESKQYLKDQNLNPSLLDTAQAFHTAEFDNLNLENTGIKVYNFVGCQAATISKIIKKPDGGFVLDYGPGDETVPMFSANNVPGATKFYALSGSHAQLLTQPGVREQILNIIAGTNLQTEGKITPFASDCVFNGKKVSVHSPVDLHIYDESGNHVGPTPGGGFEHSIPGVSYDVLGHEKFAFLPLGQNYTIKLQATGPGDFDFYSSEVIGGETTKTVFYGQVPVEASSTATIVMAANSSTVINLDLNGDGQTDRNISPSSVLDSAESQDLIPPASTSSIIGLAGEPGFYRSDVVVNLVAADPIITGQEAETSGVLSIRYNLDNTGYQTYSTTTSLSISNEGQHTLSFFSTDRAGNTEAPQTVVFTIDKTSPEYEVYFDITKKDFVFNEHNAASSSSQAACSGHECFLRDLAGNNTTINFAEKSEEGEKQLKLLSLAYNQASKDLPENRLKIEIKQKKDRIKELDQAYRLNKKEFLAIEYSSEKDESKIIIRLADGKKVKTRERGLKILHLTTDRGLVQYAVK